METVKVVINICWGGFGVSDSGSIEYNRRTGVYLGSDWDISRTDPALVAMVEENSALYSGRSASLKVVEVPADVKWYIHDYDGQEHVAERHRTWS